MAPDNRLWVLIFSWLDENGYSLFAPESKRFKNSGHMLADIALKDKFEAFISVDIVFEVMREDFDEILKDFGAILGV